jgi:uncharacterized protein (TIGR00730 family)
VISLDTRPTSVCVFCGSSPGNVAAYAAAGARLGVELARSGMTLVYGGGNVGLMGVLASAVLEAGGRAVGVIPRQLVEAEIAHRGLSELHVVQTMHERKQRMADLSDAFILMPGGFGSWEEFCEVVTWSQLGIHRKAFGILNVLDYYGPLLSMADHAVRQGFVQASHRQMIVVDDDPAALLVRLGEPRAPADVKWTTGSRA